MHFLAMVAFAAFVSAVFAGLSNDVHETRERVIHGLKVFASFVGVGLGLAFLMYFIP